MRRGKIVVTNAAGLHLRPAGLLCKEALRYKSQITLKKDYTVSNAKSVLSVLGACVMCGDEIELICEGDDEDKAFYAIKKLLEKSVIE